MTKFSGPAAAKDKQRTIGAEFKRASVAFGVRQDAGEFLRVGVVKQDLFLSSHREQRSPRAGGHRGHGRRARSDDYGLKKNVFRTSGGTAGLADITVESQVDFRTI